MLGKMSFATVCVALGACGLSDYSQFEADYERGLKAGYAVGYFRACEKRDMHVSGVEGDAFRLGYREGKKIAELECKFGGV